MNIRRCISFYICCICLCCPGSSFAFSYSEHKIITFRAFESVCNELDAFRSKQQGVDAVSKDAFSEICGNPLLYICFGHYVAISGDILNSPDTLSALLTKMNYMSNESIDCSNLAETGSAESENVYVDLFDEKSRLGGNPLERILRIANLASKNETHFNPEAPEQWSHYFELTSTKAGEGGDLLELLASNAFAIHFLQDAFAAGHHGLRRRAYRQSFDQAHHDYFNSNGIFLSNDEGSWFGYGDRNLYRKTHYLVSPKGDEIDLNLMIRELSKLLDTTYKKNDDGEYENIEDVEDVLNSESDIRMTIKLRRDNGAGNDIFVMLNDAPTADGSCGKPESLSQLKLFTCSSTYHHVYEQTKKSILLFVRMYMNDKDPSVPLTYQSIVESFPTKFALKNSNTDYVMGEGPVLSRYGMNYNCYTYIVCRNAQIASTDFTVLSLSYLELPKRLSGGIGEYSLELNLAFSVDAFGSFNSFLSPTVSFGFVINEGEFRDFFRFRDSSYEPFDESLIDGFGFGFKFFELRDPWRNVLGVSCGVAAGADEIWRSARYFYYTYGCAIDIQFGKYVVRYEEPKSRFSQNGKEFGFEGSRISFELISLSFD